MPREPAWQVRDDLVRVQLALFLALGDEIRISDEERRRALGLDEPGWLEWTRFVAAGPVPAEPPLPDMLLRVGETAFALAVAAEGRLSSAG